MWRYGKWERSGGKTPKETVKNEKKGVLKKDEEQEDLKLKKKRKTACWAL